MKTSIVTIIFLWIGISSLLANSMDMADGESNNINSVVNRTTLLSGQPAIMEPYTSPFAALGGGLSLGKILFCLAALGGLSLGKIFFCLQTFSH